jgi:hypothetical protein
MDGSVEETGVLKKKEARPTISLEPGLGKKT